MRRAYRLGFALGGTPVGAGARRRPAHRHRGGDLGGGDRRRAGYRRGGPGRALRRDGRRVRHDWRRRYDRWCGDDLPPRLGERGPWRVGSGTRSRVDNRPPAIERRRRGRGDRPRLGSRGRDLEGLGSRRSLGGHRPVGPARRPPGLYLVALGTRGSDRGPSDHARSLEGRLDGGHVGRRCWRPSRLVYEARPERTTGRGRRRLVRLGQALLVDGQLGAQRWRRRQRSQIPAHVEVPARVDRWRPDEVLVRRTGWPVPAVAAVVHHCLPRVRHTIIPSGARRNRLTSPSGPSGRR
jgi:hypothetical protein